jgi:molybdopterin-guanine dinucleotide biosynthesis protein A
MGRDKALLTLNGRALAVRVADALKQAGARDVVCVGGDVAGLGELGLGARADPRQGEGPLGGLISALEHATDELVVVLATDLVAIDATTVGALVVALDRHGAADVAVAVAPPGRRQPLCAVWRRTRCLPSLRDAFERGERAVHRALSELAVCEVSVELAVVRNANTPDDLRDPGRDDLPR